MEEQLIKSFANDIRKKVVSNIKLNLTNYYSDETNKWINENKYKTKYNIVFTLNEIMKRKSIYREYFTLQRVTKYNLVTLFSNIHLFIDVLHDDDHIMTINKLFLIISKNELNENEFKEIINEIFLKMQDYLKNINETRYKEIPMFGMCFKEHGQPYNQQQKLEDIKRINDENKQIRQQRENIYKDGINQKKLEDQKFMQKHVKLLKENKVESQTKMLVEEHGQPHKMIALMPIKEHGQPHKSFINKIFHGLGFK
jgi:hypothetical protein